MRSIIINTLGAAHSRKDVYFLAFDPDQILWLDSELDQLHNCVQLIQKIQRQQTLDQDYHVIVLLDEDSFTNSEFADYRDRLKKVLRAWLVVKLLKPLDELSLTPCCATEIFVSSKNRDRATSPVRSYCEMLQKGTEDLPTTFRLPYLSNEEEHALDLTGFLGLDFTAEKEVEKPTENAVHTLPLKGTAPVFSERDHLFDEDDTDEELQEKKAERRRDSLELNISNAIRKLQEFRLIRNEKQILPIQTIELLSSIQDRKAINADLQINLARLIRSVGEKKAPDLSVVRWHNPSELVQLMEDAQASLKLQISQINEQKIYYQLEEDLYNEQDIAEIEQNMRQRLREEADDVPGVGDALDELDEGDVDAEERNMMSDDGVLAAQVRKEIQSGMLLFIKERKRFQQRYEELRKEYDREKVLDEQKRVFDICAGGYTEWRTNERKKRPHREAKPTEIRRPMLEKEKNKEVLAARDRCAEGVLSQLNDYADVREEAAKLHTEFSSLAQLWTPDLHTLNSRYFYRFSVVMGLLFVVLMVLPFFLISGQTADLKMSRYLAYLINFGLFLVLYLIGFLYWLHRQAKAIRELRGDLEILILKSERNRRESVLQAIATYTRDLPSCIIKQLNYSVMVEIDKENGAASRKYEQHMQYISDAGKEISDVMTALRRQASEEGKPSGAKLDLLRAPYDPVNQKFYMLFTERSVNAGDHH